MQNTGLAAVKAALEANKAKMDKTNKKGQNNEPKITKYLENGETVLVRVPSTDCMFFYESHSFFTKNKEERIAPHACHKQNGAEDLYDKAAVVLIKEAGQYWESDFEKAKKIRQYSNRFESSPRVKFGFYNLADGEPFIIDISLQHAEAIITNLEKHGNKIGKMAFELTRQGEQTSTTYSLTPFIDDLSEDQESQFEACGKKEFDTSVFTDTLYFKGEHKQLEDIKFMLSKMELDIDVLAELGFESSPKSTSKQVEKKVDVPANSADGESGPSIEPYEGVEFEDMDQALA